MEIIRFYHTIEREEVTSQHDKGRVLKHGVVEMRSFLASWRYILANQCFATTRFEVPIMLSFHDFLFQESTPLPSAWSEATQITLGLARLEVTPLNSGAYLMSSHCGMCPIE